jgi:hypothetical protein
VDKFAVETLYYKKAEWGISVSRKIQDLLLDSDSTFDSLSVGFYMIWGYSPQPKTLYSNIHVVPGGKLISLKLDSNNFTSTQTYWDCSSFNVENDRDELAFQLYDAIRQSVLKRAGERNSILTSGGLDSAVALDVLQNNHKNPYSITGNIKGYGAYDLDFDAAEKLSRYKKSPHLKLVIDPNDEKLIDKWKKAVTSWRSATHEGLLLWYCMMESAAGRIGNSGRVFSCETADRLAHNELTGDNIGCRVARFFYSDTLFRFFDFPDLGIPKFFKKYKSSFVSAASEVKLGLPVDVLTSICASWGNREEYFYGLIFPGKSELPGIQEQVFNSKFRAVRPGAGILKEWMDKNFVRPFIGNITPETYYYDLIRLRLAWCVQGVNMRVIRQMADYHNLKVCLPFLDTDVVNIFCSLPPWTRRFYKSGKYFYRYAAAQNSQLPDFTIKRRSDAPHPRSLHEILLEGVLGEYIRELLKTPTFLNALDSSIIDTAFLGEQIQKFIQNSKPYRYDVVMKSAVLESWYRMLK